MAKLLGAPHAAKRTARENQRASGWQAESMQINRLKAKRKRMASWRKRAVMITLCTVPMYLGLASWWLWHSGDLQRMQDMSKHWLQRQMSASGFVVKHVSITGLERLTPDTILHTANISGDTPMFWLSLTDLKRIIQSHPHIQAVQIEREMPNRLRLHITERSPKYLWQHDGERYWLDSEGVMLDEAWVAQQPPQHFTVLIGAYAPAHLQSLSDIIASAPALQPHIRSATWVGDRRWNVMLNNGLQIMLPMEHAAQAWKNFAQFEADFQLSQRALAKVDMRLEGKVFLHYLPDMMQQDQQVIKELVTASIQ